MATVAGLRTDVFEYLYGNYPTDRPFETVLAEALDNAETEVDVLDGTDWSEGAILQHGTTGEQMLVLSVATNTLTVKRSYSTVAATAGSAGTDDLVQKNPRWTIEQVDNAVQSAIDSLELWGVHTFNTGSITLVASQYFYAVDGSTWMEPYNVLAVYYPRTDTENPVYLPFSSSGARATVHPPARSTTPSLRSMQPPQISPPAWTNWLCSGRWPSYLACPSLRLHMTRVPAPTGPCSLDRRAGMAAGSRESSTFEQGLSLRC